MVVDKAVEDGDYSCYLWVKVLKDKTIEIVKTRLIKKKRKK